MSSTLITISGLSAWSYGQVSIPNTNYIYTLANSNRAGVYYYQVSSPSPITPTFYSLSLCTDVQ